MVLEQQLKATIKVRSELALSMDEILSDPKLDYQTRQAHVAAMLPVMRDFTTQQSHIEAELEAVDAEIRAGL
jgi:hypothetical protein